MGIDFPCFAQMFNILINIHEYTNETIIRYAHDINIFFIILYYWCSNSDNNNLGLKLVYSWIYNQFKSL